MPGGDCNGCKRRPASRNGSCNGCKRHSVCRKRVCNGCNRHPACRKWVCNGYNRPSVSRNAFCNGRKTPAGPCARRPSSDDRSLGLHFCCCFVEYLYFCLMRDYTLYIYSRERGISGTKACRCRGCRGFDPSSHRSSPCRRCYDYLDRICPCRCCGQHQSPSWPSQRSRPK